MPVRSGLPIKSTLTQAEVLQCEAQAEVAGIVQLSGLSAFHSPYQSSD